MKKSIIAVVLLLLIIAALPIIGNTFVKHTIDERLLELTSLGLEVNKDKTESTYLQSQRHFELLLKDSKNFIKHLSQYNEQQIPPYVNAMLDGAVIGVDVTYSNLPFAKAFVVEFYPLTLSKELELSLTQNDALFYKYVEKFLQAKGVLYHINYNLLNEDFDGYIKDIDEKYSLSSGVDIALDLKKATFKGNGELLAPNELISKIGKFRLDAQQDAKEFHVVMNNLSGTSSFESESTYITAGEIESMELNLTGTDEDMTLDIKSLRINASSNDQGSDVELNSKSSIDKLVVHSKALDVNMSKFNFDIALSDLDKKSFEELRILVAQNSSNTNGTNNPEIQKSMMKLLSKGMILNIVDFSLENIQTARAGDLKGFKVDTTMTLKEDAMLAEKVKVSPLLALSGLEVITNIKISKEMFHFLAKSAPMLTNLYKYAKEENNDLIFNMNFVDSKPTINGKTLN